MSHNISDLGHLEREVLNLVWKHGATNADAVQKLLGRPLKESTVRTVLRRLEAKGYVSHTLDGRTYIYKAVEGRGRAVARAVKRLVDRFCNGSVEEALVGMVDAQIVDRRELQRLADKIAKAQAEHRAEHKADNKEANKAANKGAKKS